MTQSKSKLKSAPTRNTLNQRASRARRKDYIRDLERQVREWQDQGVKVTEQIQAAARRVAEENRALREEIRALKERNALLEEIVGWRGPATGGCEASGPSMEEFDPRGAEDICPPSRSQLGIEEIAETAHAQHPSATVLPNSNSTPSLSSSPSTPVSLTSASPLSEQSQSQCPPGLKCSPLHAPNSTSCAQAAMIIASIRGLATTDNALETEILPELGCDVTQGDERRGGHGSTCSGGYEDARLCVVDNALLFAILDQDRPCI